MFTNIKKVIAIYFLLQIGSTISYNHKIQITKDTVDEWPSYNIVEPKGPGTYAFGYEINDFITGNIHFKNEERFENGTVIGSYGLILPNGIITVISYVSDRSGYRFKVINTETSQQTFLMNLQDSYTRPASISQKQQIVKPINL